jgi:hypothetical protein
MEKQLRKNRSRLRIFGGGVIAFTLWSLLKPLLLSLMLEPDEPAAPIEVSELSNSVLIFVLVLILLDVLLAGTRIFIGLSARAEGRGKPKGKTYVVFAFLIFSIQFLLLIFTVVQLIRGESEDQTVLDAAGALIVEVGSVVTMGETAVTAVRVKKLAAAVREAG